MIVNSTPHNQCTDTDLIAKIVLMPGDPKRAEFLANTYLDNVIKFNEIRGMYGFTGYYKGKKVSVMGSGMGMASIGIYSFELFKFYGVEKIIRIGSCGAYDENLNLFDVILVSDAFSESTYAQVFSGDLNQVQPANTELNDEIRKAAKSLNKKIYEGRVHSSDVFYRMHGTDHVYFRNEFRCLAVEMESFSLFAIAKALHKKAACILTVSDSFCFTKQTTPIERQSSFNNMMEIALKVAENQPE